jgi:hypothetical protein
MSDHKCRACQKNDVGEGTFLCEACRQLEIVPNGRGGLGAGLGAPANRMEGLPSWGQARPKASSIGLGCGGFDDPLTFLHHGFPRLALVRALGVPLAPWCINIRMTWDTPDVQVTRSEGTDGKITQDTFMDGMIARFSLDRTPTNPFDAPSDFALQFTNNIEATLDVHGTPRYTVTADFTPVSTLTDVFNGNSKWPFGWVLTYQQQLKMQAQNRIQLPGFPATLICTFRGWQPVTDLLVNMTNRQAAERLRAMGYTIPDSYLDYLR